MGAPAIAILLAFAAAPPPARTAALDWRRGSGAEGCLDGLALARAVEERLGRTVFVDRAAAEVVVTGSVQWQPEPAPGRWGARIAISSRAGEVLGTRELTVDGRRCEELSLPVALIVAVMLDPDPARQRAPVVVAAPPPPPPPAPWRYGLEAGGQAGLGLLPGMAPGLLARIAIEPPAGPRFALRVDLSGERPVDVRPGVETRFQTMGLGLWACPFALDGAAAGLRACAGAELDRVSVRSRGFDVSEDSARLIPVAGIELRATFHLGRHLSLFAGAEGLLPLVRERFFYRDADGATEHDLFRVWPAATRLTAGLGWTSP